MTRLGYGILASVAVLGIAVTSAVPMPPKLVWNASASTPIGLYAISPADRLALGDLVLAMPPAPLARFMAGRRYIGAGVPLLKHVAALPGQEVCRLGRRITVDAVPFGEALDRDRQGRALPVWQGCRRLAGGELFLMNRDVGDSMDGRYFGPLPASAVRGRAIPLFTDPHGDGRFVWRAPPR